MAAKKEQKAFTIPALNKGRLQVTLVGDSPLTSHRWSEKAKREMLWKQMKKAKQAKTAKDPRDDYAQSLYIINEQEGDRAKVYDSDNPKVDFGFPSTAFKNAAVAACRAVDGIAMTEARGAFHVNLGEELVKISGTPEMREDMVRISGGTADIRYRGSFPKWHTTLDVTYNENALSPEQIINLFNTAGFAVGVGEARPEKNGAWGMFHVATGDELEELGLE